VAKPRDHLYVVILDDAQKIYKFKDFWDVLVKGVWIPTNYVFIVCATYILKSGTDTPTELQLVPRLSRDDFLLTNEESEELFDRTWSPPTIMDKFGMNWMDLKSNPEVRNPILNQCGNVIGALRLSVKKICECFRDGNPTVEDILSYFLLSSRFLQELPRVFGEHNEPVDPAFSKFFREFFSSPSPMKPTPKHEETLETLIKCGVMFQENGKYEFTSTLAKRYYFRKIFPSRPTELPKSLKELVLNAIEKMSSIVLEKSVVSSEDFPKEAVFQQEFFAGLQASLPPQCSICPELSKTFADVHSRQTTISGEIDFFINGDLRWGIELLVNGGKIGEHMERFSQPNGKYSALNPKDYYVVDFRRSRDGNSTNVRRYQNRISIFFPIASFSRCTCTVGLDEEYELNLSA
jgi:hypothetical protein